MVVTMAAVQQQMEDEAEDVYWCVCANGTRYQQFAQVFKGLRHDGSVYHTAIRGPFGTRFPQMLDVESVLERHKETMASFGMSAESPIDMRGSEGHGLRADPAEMMTLVILLEFLEGRCSIDLWDPSVVNRRITTAFTALGYTDGWPSANTDMCDCSWWLVDHARSIFKGDTTVFHEKR